MNKLTLCISILLISFTFAEDDVLVLTDETFDEAVKKNPIMMVKFFAPWCGHCQAFAPEYERLAKEVKITSKPYVIAEVDATKSPKTATAQGVGSYPTVMLYLNGVSYVYGGSRTVEAILEFILKRISPFSTLLKSVEEIAAKKKGSGLKSILASVDKSELELYSRVGERIEGYECFNAEPELVKQVFANAEKGNVVIIKDFDEEIVVYSDPLTEGDLEEFMKMHKIPVVIDANQDLVKDVFNTGKKTGILLIRSTSYPEINTIEEEFHKVALSLRSRDMVFAKTDVVESWGQRVGTFLGIEDASTPILEIVMKKEEFYRYRLEGAITADNIHQFINDYKQGKLPRYMKSEQEPKENSGPIYKVVGKTFKREVLDNDFDVVVKFYATWCRQCKKLVPIYKSLAETLKTNPKLKLVEIDATKNDIEGHLITAYPTIKLFPGKNKADVQVYEGDRSEEDLIRFINEKGSYPELNKKGDL